MGRIRQARSSVCQFMDRRGPLLAFLAVVLVAVGGLATTDAAIHSTREAIHSAEVRERRAARVTAATQKADEQAQAILRYEVALLIAQVEALGAQPAVTATSPGVTTAPTTPTTAAKTCNGKAAKCG